MRFITTGQDDVYWQLTPIFRFVERIIHDVPTEGNPNIFGGRTEKVLQQKYKRLDPHHYESDGTYKWMDVKTEKEE